MSNLHSANTFAVVECHGDQATVRFTDNSIQQVPSDVLARSMLLRQALLGNDKEEENVTLPEVILQSWLRWLHMSADLSDAPSAKEQSSASNPAAQKLIWKNFFGPSRCISRTKHQVVFSLKPNDAHTAHAPLVQLLLCSHLWGVESQLVYLLAQYRVLKFPYQLSPCIINAVYGLCINLCIPLGQHCPFHG